MSNDKDKLLQIMASLESDYAHGKISKEKYIYFRSKYEDKLNALDAKEATNRIRSMQGKPSNSPKIEKSPINKDKKEEEDLVQKYIINPKKGDKELKEKTPMDSNTFKLIAVLVLAIGFTCGAAFGVFNFDFKSFSPNDASAIVTDTAFPDVKDISLNTTSSNNSYSGNSSYSTVQTTTSQSYSAQSYDYSSQGSYDSGSSDGGSNSPSSTGDGSQDSATPTI